MSISTGGNDHMATEAHASLLTSYIADLGIQLRQDLGHVEPRNVLSEIRELRRSLTMLEYELIDDLASGHGDAC